MCLLCLPSFITASSGKSEKLSVCIVKLSFPPHYTVDALFVFFYQNTCSNKIPCGSGRSNASPCSSDSPSCKPFSSGSCSCKPCIYGSPSCKPCIYGSPSCKPCSSGSPSCKCYISTCMWNIAFSQTCSYQCHQCALSAVLKKHATFPNEFCHFLHEAMPG